MSEVLRECAGLIYGRSFHYIDHLVPLCEMLSIPILVTEEEMERGIRQFYPNIAVKQIDTIRLPEYVVSHFSMLFVCTPRALFDEVFFFLQALYHKRVHTIWCPHGNSDKGHIVPCMEALDKEESLLIYGEKMLEFLRSKQVAVERKRVLEVGNYRKRYYEDNKGFYDRLVYETLLYKLPKGKKNILYAPTWEDAEGSSSFYTALPALVDSLPQEYNLLVKPHPNLLLDAAGKGESWISQYEGREGVVFLKEFPPVYPLLALADIYVGDLSSIGYDALAFPLPMFYLSKGKRDRHKDPGLYLYQCGVEIGPSDYPNIYKLVKEALVVDVTLFFETRKQVYEYTFAKESASKEQLQRKMEIFCGSILDEEPDVF